MLHILSVSSHDSLESFDKNAAGRNCRQLSGKVALPAKKLPARKILPATGLDR
jgi:hypothetical protein